MVTAGEMFDLFSTRLVPARLRRKQGLHRVVEKHLHHSKFGGAVLIILDESFEVAVVGFDLQYVVEDFETRKRHEEIVEVRRYQIRGLEPRNAFRNLIV